VAAPAAQLLLAASVLASWRLEECRWLLASAFVCLIVANVITLKFHYPRNRLLFESPATTDAEVLAVAAREWGAGNLVRVVLVAGGWAATLLALVRIALVVNARGA
jgi:uncharacterized membrane protein